MRLTSLDYPSAWAIQREVGDQLDHDPQCSSVPGHSGGLSGPGFLCDCDAVPAEWERRRARLLTDDQGRSLTGRCGHCGHVADNHDDGHRVTAITAGGRGVECVLRGDIEAHEAAPLGRRP